MVIFRYFFLVSILLSYAHAKPTLAEIAMPATLLIIAIVLVIALLIHLKQLQKSERLWATLFNYAPQSQLIFNKKNKIINVNKKMQTQLGLSESTLQNQVWYERLLPDEMSISLRHKLYKQATESIPFAFTYVTPKGTTFVLECELTPLPHNLTLLSTRSSS